MMVTNQMAAFSRSLRGVWSKPNPPSERLKTHPATDEAEMASNQDDTAGRMALTHTTRSYFGYVHI